MPTHRTALFRAVAFEELIDIISRKGFRNPKWIEHKYFAETLAGAQQYARLAEFSYGEGPFRIVSTRIDTSLLAVENRVVVDGGIATVTVRTEMLYALDEPEIEPEIGNA